MSDTQDRLFDVTDYGGDITPKEKAAEARRLKDVVPVVVERHRDPWVLMRNKGGVAPYFHLIKAVNPEMASVAVCGLMGTTITNTGVTHMVRCPECQAGALLAGLSVA